MIEFQIANDVTQCSRAQILNCRNWAFYAVGIELRICDLEIDHCIDLHGNVILCDNRLGWKIDHLFL